MLTDQCYTQLAVLLHTQMHNGGGLWIAVGRGDASWDSALPAYDRSSWQLVDEVARKAIDPADIQYLDTNGAITTIASPRLMISASFEEGEGEGSLRECGLYMRDAASAEDRLLSYFMHGRIEKGPGMVLRRRINIDLTPRASGAGNIVSRYLGNSGSQEFHDLDNEQTGCRIAQIRADRRVYFSSPEQATLLNYDYCAYCFGRELSRR